MAGAAIAIDVSDVRAVRKERAISSRFVLGRKWLDAFSHLSVADHTA